MVLFHFMRGKAKTGNHQTQIERDNLHMRRSHAKAQSIVCYDMEISVAVTVSGLSAVRINYVF